MNDDELIRQAQNNPRNFVGSDPFEGCLLVCGVVGIVVLFLVGTLAGFVSDTTGTDFGTCFHWGLVIAGLAVFLWALIKIPVFRFMAAMLTATAVGMGLSLFLLVLYGGKEILDTCKLGSVIIISLSSVGAMGLVIFLWPKRWQ